VFCAEPTNPYGSGICCCDKCKAWDSPEGEKRIFYYDNNVRVTGVADSDRQVTFTNMLARKLKERFPDKDYKVMMRAFGFHRSAPIRAVPDDNVIVSNIANFFADQESTDINSAVGTKCIDQFEGWLKITKNQVWRPNAGNSVKWQTGGPSDITGTGELFKKIGNSGILGIDISMVNLYWATQGPEYYLMAQLVWNPEKGIDEIMDDYYKSGFGSAAEEIKAYWKMLENNKREIQKNDKKKGGKSWAEAFSPDFFKEAYSLLDKSAEKVSKSGQEYSDRVAFVRAGLDYLRLNTENQALVKEILESKGDRPDLVEKMRANWKQIEEIVLKHPEALRKNDVMKSRASGNLKYIHPDTDHRKIEEQRLRKAASAGKKKKNIQAMEEEGE